MGENVTFTSNGSEGQGYLALPASPGPGLIVIQEWWGLVDHIREVCDRYAAEGFVTLAPDLFRGESTTEPDEAGKLMMGLNLGRAVKDMGGAVDYVLARDESVGPQVGVTGFCMGGGLALALATQRPDAIGACAPFYGIIPWESMQPDWTSLDCPVRGHFAELDEFFGPDMVRELEATLTGLGKDAALTVHAGVDHAFFNDTRPEVYDESTSRQAFDETVAFLRAELSG